jgi:diguanylate cyclase (GGDEF)-like protein
MGQRRVLLLALLAGLAVLANAFPVPLCFSVQILLGSIVSIFTLLWLRGWWNVPIAALASLHTWTLWGHPWAILIFSAEALWLAVFINRFSGPPENDLKGRILLADVLFWLLVGAPLVFFLYGRVLLIDPANVGVVAAKQAVNGVANTLVAFLLFVLLTLARRRQKRGLLPLRGLVFSVVLAAITMPALGITVFSCAQLQQATQEGVLDNLQTVAQAAARMDPRQFDAPIRGLPASVGSAAFLLTDSGGNRISSNPALFLRLENHFIPASADQIHLHGLQMLVPREQSLALKMWINGYWSLTQTSRHYLVQVVQPAGPLVLKLQRQSTDLLNTLLLVMLLGLAISEAVAALMERQLRVLHSPTSGAGPEECSAIAEIQELVARLNDNRREEERLRQDLSAVSERLEQSSRQQRLLATTDPLTGAASRSELEHSLAQISQRARACSVPLSCLAFALHGLRPINASFGRQRGDEVLQRLIAHVKERLHSNDELFRIGGSEFLLLLWDQPLETARSTADQIHRIVSEMALPPGDGPPRKLAMSAGVSLLGAADQGGQAMLSRVELALNQSRELGANQVVVR